jgi:phosphoserine phosphatase RsbU/P
MSLHILVVDDEPDVELLIRQRFRRRIRSEELAFSFARDGFDALAVLDKEPSIELILSDINMPRMDGLTLLRRVADLDRLLKVVIVSAYGDLENIRTAMNRGAFDFITKPIDFADLDATIEKSGVEIEVLRRAMTSERELTSLRRELDIARDIQLSFCPLEVTGVFDGVRVHGMTKPAREVGGDFYDFFPLGEGRYGFAIGDVAGKGLGAALFMAVTRTMLRATALQQRSVTGLLEHINVILSEDAPSRMFVTCIFGIYDCTTGTVSYANAGHNPPVLRRADGSVSLLRDARGPALCLMPSATYRENVIHLSESDALLLYTDGVTEAAGSGGMRYDDDRLLISASETLRQDGPSMVEHVMESVLSFSVAEQHDDITLLVLAPAARVNTQTGRAEAGVSAA